MGCLYCRQMEHQIINLFKSSDMLKKLILLGVCFFSFSCLQAQQNVQPVPVIFDTDMGPDYDDVGAIAMLHAFAERGEANILATVASTKYEGVAAVLSVLNTYFNRSEIPIGVPKGDALMLRDSQHWTDTLIHVYPHHLKRNSEAPDAVALYREILAQQPDSSVTIITVGFLTNLAGLLQSAPDEFSDMPGKELVAKKVKRLVSMAGKFPEGQEFNVKEDAPAAQYTADNWPGAILFSGFEIGEKIKTGLPLVQNKKIKNSPVQHVYSISIPRSEQDQAGRMSWDQTAVLVAVRGHAPYYQVKPGTIRIQEDGSNTWSAKGSKHGYLVERKPASEVQRVIDELMMHQPKE